MNTEYREPQQVVNMRVRAAAKYMACGVSTVWYWAKKGLITPVKLSDRVTIFRKDDLDRFIERNSGGAEK